MRSRVLRLTGKKLTLRFITHVLVVGHRPPTSTSRPPDVIHMIGIPRPSPFFTAFPHPPYIIHVTGILHWTQTEQQKWGRPGNEARALVAQARSTGLNSWQLACLYFLHISSNMTFIVTWNCEDNTSMTSLLCMLSVARQPLSGYKVCWMLPVIGCSFITTHTMY